MRNQLKIKDASKVLSEIENLISNSQNILLLTHRKPDGDGLGSLFSFALILDKLGKKSKAVCIDPLPYLYQFLPGRERLEHSFNLKEFDSVFIFDCADKHLTGFQETHPRIFEKSIPPPAVNIDHHCNNSYFGAVNLVDGEASSTSELLYLLFQELRLEIDREIASCLLTGIFTDTGSFQHQNTTVRSLEIASELLARGAKIDKIAHYTMRTKRLSTLRLWGRVMSNLFVNKNYDLAIAVITQEDLDEVGATQDDIEGIANFLNTIPDARAILVLTEKEGGIIKGSLRTRHEKVDVLRLAQLFGGGGHIKAAGFAVKGELVKGKNGWEIK